jgi:hypothetical protein
VASPPEAESTWWLVCAFIEKENKKERKNSILFFKGYKLVHVNLIKKNSIGSKIRGGL